MTRHLVKLLDAIWYLSMGLFLGLTGGLVLSVIMTFRGARTIDATPGVEPYSDPQFAEYHNDAVAGYIGQDLFMVGGTVALVLLGFALLSRLTAWCVMRFIQKLSVGICLTNTIRSLCLTICLLCMGVVTFMTIDMNKHWHELYDTNASDKQLAERRAIFEYQHKQSEKFSSSAWLSGFAALALSPWCRRLADEPGKAKAEDRK